MTLEFDFTTASGRGQIARQAAKNVFGDEEKTVQFLSLPIKGDTQSSLDVAEESEFGMYKIISTCLAHCN